MFYHQPVRRWACLLILTFGWCVVAADDRSSSRTIRLWNGLSHWDGARTRARIAVFSRDGTVLASASARSVKLSSAADGTEIRTLAAPDGWIAGLALTPDGKHLVTAGERYESSGDDENSPGSYEGFVRVWSLQDAEVVRSFRSQQRISCLDLSADGKLLAVGFSSSSHSPPGDDPVVAQVRSLETGRVLHSFRTGRPGIRSIAFSPDRKRLAAAASNEGAVLVWSLESGQTVHRYTKGQLRVSSVAWDPQGTSTLLAAGSFDGTVTLWSAGTGENVRTFRWPHDDTLNVPIESIAFSSDGKTLAAGSAESPWDADAVALWSVASGEKVDTSFSGRREANHSVAFAPDGKHLAAAGGEGSVKVWSVATGELYPWPGEGHSDRILSVALSADGKTLASGGRDGTVCIWSVATGKEVRRLELEDGGVAIKVALGPRGKLLAYLVAAATASPDSTPFVRLLSLPEAKVIRSFEEARGTTDLSFNPDASLLACFGRGGDSVRIWDTETGRKKLELKTDTDTPGILDLAWRPDGQTLATTGYKKVDLWAVETGKRGSSFLRHLPGPRSPEDVLGLSNGGIWSVALSPDGRTAASAGWLALKVWSTDDGKEISSLEGHRHWITSVAFSPDGALLASADMDGFVRLWDARTGRAQHVWSRPGATRILGFVAGGDALATANPDGTVSLLEVPAPAQRSPGLPDSAPSDSGGPRPLARRGRLLLSMIVSGKEFHFDNWLTDIFVDVNGDCIVPTMNGQVYRVSADGKPRVLLDAFPVLQAITSALRDPLSGKLIVTCSFRHGIYEIAAGGHLFPLLVDDELGRPEDIIPGDAGRLIATDPLTSSVLRISRKGEIEVMVQSPLLRDLRGIARDRRDKTLVVAARGNLFTLDQGGKLATRISANRLNPLRLPNRIVQDRTSERFFVADQDARALYSVDRQGSTRLISRLPKWPAAIAQDGRNGDLVITINGPYGILRLSGFVEASESEIESWIGVQTPILLKP